MKRCPRCDINFSGEHDLCPLCASTLIGEGSTSPFPASLLLAPKQKVNHIVGALSVLIALVAILGGLYLQQNLLAISSELLALLLNYIFLRNVVMHSPIFLRIIQRYFLLILAIMLLLLAVTQQNVIATYIIPTICLVALITNGVLVIVFRDSFVKGYAKYLLYELVLGFLPLLLMVTGLVSWPYLAVISAVVSALLLVLLLILCRKQLTLEFKKLFSA